MICFLSRIQPPAYKGNCCTKNRMIVNNLKTKAMKFGRKSEFTLSFQGQKIDVVNNYKYLGNKVSSRSRSGSDIFQTIVAPILIYMGVMFGE